MLQPCKSKYDSQFAHVMLPLLQVIRRLPNLRKLDGIPVDVDEREQANASKS